MHPTTTSSALAGAPRVQRPRHFLDPVRFDEVADLDVVEVLDPDAAFEPFPHFAGVVLEPLQRGQRAVVHLDAAADHPHPRGPRDHAAAHERDRKSTRLNSSHVAISYAVFCLKKKKKITLPNTDTEHTTDK